MGAEVARLLSDGTPPGEIAIVLRDPRSAGPLYRRVLTRFQIPVAVQADMAAARTNTGAGLIALLQASVGRGRASDLLAYLRTPGVASPSKVDWFERRLLRDRLRTTDQALEAWSPAEEDGGDGLREVRKLRDAKPGPELLRAAGKQARWIAESAVRRQGVVAEEDRALELRAGAEIEKAMVELAELGLPHSAADVIAAVSDLDVPMWRGPTEGRVRVISPYRARARRVAHLFVSSMQDGDFPRRDTGGPLLSDDARRGPGVARAKEGRDRGPLPLLGLPVAAEAAALALVAERRRRGRRDVALALRRRGPRPAGAATAPGPGGAGRSDPGRGRRAWPGRVRLRARLGAQRGGAGASRGGGRAEGRERTPSARAAPARSGAGADAGDQAVRPLDARGVRHLSVPLVHPARAEAAAGRAGGRAADERVDRAQGSRGALREATRVRRATHAGDARRVAPGRAES